MVGAIVLQCDGIDVAVVAAAAAAAVGAVVWKCSWHMDFHCWIGRPQVVQDTWCIAAAADNWCSCLGLGMPSYQRLPFKRLFD